MAWIVSQGRVDAPAAFTGQALGARNGGLEVNSFPNTCFLVQEAEVFLRTPAFCPFRSAASSMDLDAGRRRFRLPESWVFELSCIVLKVFFCFDIRPREPLIFAKCMEDFAYFWCQTVRLLYTVNVYRGFAQ